MLIEFKFANYKSFKGSTHLSMVGVKSFKEHEPQNVTHLEEGLKLLKSAVVVGGNGSGKSNLVDAVAFMKSTVLNSFSEALVDNDEKKFPLVKFLLDTSKETAPSEFEVSFVQDGIKYKYGFCLGLDEVTSEWLYKNERKEVLLFRRNQQNIEVKASFKEGKGLEEKVRKNVLFLTVVAQLNGSISNSVVKWFRGIGILRGVNDDGYKGYTIKKLRDDKRFHAFASHLLRGIEITNISTASEALDFDVKELEKKERDADMVEMIRSIHKVTSKIPAIDKVKTWHRRYDEKNYLVDSIPFDLDKQESEGTKKLLYLLGPWYDSLKSGKVFFVDELDSRLHSKMTRILTSLFNAGRNKAAQLIYTTHDTSLLDHDMYRRDQIWFVEKNQFGASELYSLSEFDSSVVRGNTAFDRQYLEGKFGGLPIPVNCEELVDLVFNE